MANLGKFKVDLPDPMGCKGKLWIDDLELTSHTTGFKVEAHVGDLSKITVHLIAQAHELDINGEIEIALRVVGKYLADEIEVDGAIFRRVGGHSEAPPLPSPDSNPATKW